LGALGDAHLDLTVRQVHRHHGAQGGFPGGHGQGQMQVFLPPNDKVKDEDLKTLVKWILAGAK